MVSQELLILLALIFIIWIAEFFSYCLFSLFRKLSQEYLEIELLNSNFWLKWIVVVKL
jgi:hypothetical protein